MTPEQRQRALRHYEREAAVALRIEQMEAALRKYGRHEGRCVSFFVAGGKCTCGFRAALAKAGAGQ